MRRSCERQASAGVARQVQVVKAPTPSLTCPHTHTPPHAHSRSYPYNLRLPRILVHSRHPLTTVSKRVHLTSTTPLRIEIWLRCKPKEAFAPDNAAAETSGLYGWNRIGDTMDKRERECERVCICACARVYGEGAAVNSRGEGA
jgi:hypothetical protein